MIGIYWYDRNLPSVNSAQPATGSLWISHPLGVKDPVDADICRWAGVVPENGWLYPEFLAISNDFLRTTVFLFGSTTLSDQPKFWKKMQPHCQPPLKSHLLGRISIYSPWLLIQWCSQVSGEKHVVGLKQGEQGDITSLQRTCGDSLGSWGFQELMYCEPWISKTWWLVQVAVRQPPKSERVPQTAHDKNTLTVVHLKSSCPNCQWIPTGPLCRTCPSGSASMRSPLSPSCHQTWQEKICIDDFPTKTYMSARCSYGTLHLWKIIPLKTSIYLSIYLSIDLSIYLPIYLSMYLCKCK